MNCEMHYVKKSDLEQIKKDLEEKQSNMFFTEIQGINIQSYKEFMIEVGKAFLFPRPAANLNAYLDWMRDLMWLPESTGFVLFIQQFSTMFLKDLSAKVNVINYFPETIFPWWDGEAELYMVGGKKKPFLVYLVEEPLEDLAKSLPLLKGEASEGQ